MHIHSYLLFLYPCIITVHVAGPEEKFLFFFVV